MPLLNPDFFLISLCSLFHNRLPMLRFFTTSALAALLLMIAAVEADAQRRVSYQQLAMQHRAPGLFIDHNIIKSGTDTENVWFNFRFSHEALNFRQSGSGDSERFEARAQVTIRVYELTRPVRQDRLRDRISGKNAVKTLNWSGTARASEFDHTRDSKRFLNGNLGADLPPGLYAYETGITLDGRSMPARSITRMFTVPDFDKEENYPVYFVRKSERHDNEFPLLNFGRSVLYAEDFDALFIIPDTDANYRVLVNQVNITERDTSRVETVFTKDTRPDDVLRAGGMRMVIGERDEPRIRLATDGSRDLGFLHVTIPNRKFQNSSFVITLEKDGEVVSRRHFRSLWIDIPISLLNVDVAIRKMELIVDRDTHRNLRRGNETERMRRFREFWKERDPEPETDYNPIMVEFYKRIDIAYERFTSPNFAGFETDQGKTFIRFGEPESVQRRFPSGRPAVEIWRYEDKEFVFEATSGFGEYRLRERNNL